MPRRPPFVAVLVLVVALVPVPNGPVAGLLGLAPLVWIGALALALAAVLAAGAFLGLLPVRVDRPAARTIVRSSIPGSDAIETCSWPSYRIRP